MRPLVIVVGLAREAHIAQAPRGSILVGGGRADRLAADIETAIAKGARRLISFGLAGGLAAGLRPGDLIVADVVVDGARRMPCDPAWAAALRQCLGKAEMGRTSAVVGVDAPIADPKAKAALHLASGASIVDMESAVAAIAAERHGLPFAVLRAVADPAESALPPAALVAMRSDGGVNLAAVLGALARAPQQLPDLVRLALDSRKAFASLKRARALLGADFASLNLGEL